LWRGEGDFGHNTGVKFVFYIGIAFIVEKGVVEG
jgi:hypothetical protein